MSRKTQASGDIARGHVSEQMRSSQGALVWTDKPWVNLKPVPTVSRDTPLENFPDCQITLARDGLTLPEIGERITALCGVRVIFSPDALAVGQSSGTTRALNGPLPVPDNNGRIPLDQLGGAVDTAGVTATPLVLSGLRWQGKLSGLLDMIAARTGLTPRMDNGAILFSLLETRTFQFTFLNTNITSNASVTSGSTSSMGTSGGTTNSSVSGDSSSSQQTTVDQSRNVYDDMKKTLETMLTPQKGRFWLSASTGTLTVTDIRSTGGWIVTRSGKGWMDETHGGGLYMSDNDWLRILNNKGFYTGGEIRGGKVRSDGDVSVGGVLDLDKINVANTYCPKDGSVSRTATGAPLSCQSGIWKNIKFSFKIGGTFQVWPGQTVNLGRFKLCINTYRIDGRELAITELIPTDGPDENGYMNWRATNATQYSPYYMGIHCFI
ncbi:shufflon system plasmid conjugative transfer pilus tip adhesin PilV [Salmonella enterica]|nr:shufflon system plasmid conjugative transfer pilus tip adhesin PilV [Salmonella enterica]